MLGIDHDRRMPGRLNELQGFAFLNILQQTFFLSDRILPAPFDVLRALHHLCRHMAYIAFIASADLGLLDLIGPFCSTLLAFFQPADLRVQPGILFDLQLKKY